MSEPSKKKKLVIINDICVCCGRPVPEGILGVKKVSMMGQMTDLSGERFGKLTVIEPTDQRKNGYMVWKCRCDCGGRIEADSRRLKRGTVKNCGCIPKSNARNGQMAEDLTGQRFGKLTVLSRAPNQNSRVYWKCRCDCGNGHIVSAHELKAGKCTSCGCNRHELEKGFVDLTGMQFDQLTVLYQTRKRSYKGSICWHCRCSCGKEVDVPEDALCFGQYKSCGCRRRELGKQLYTKRTMVDGTCVEILEKRKSRSDNSSGFRGVYQKKNGEYRACIGFKGERFYLGTFDSMHEAVQARLEAEEQIHGGFLDAYYRWNRQAEADPAWGRSHPLLFEAEKINGEIRITTNM